MPHPLEAGTIRILKPDGSTAGTGFLVSKRLAVTCAHALESAGETIQLQFTGRDEILFARPIPEYYRDPDNGDIAFLRLESVPENTTLLQLGAAEHTLSGNPFQAFGYPSVGEIEGVHARGEILGRVTENGRQLVQLRSTELNQGHSGAPIWDEKRRVVVGMVVSIYRSDESGKLRDTAFGIPSETLWQVCPEIRLVETVPYQGLETFTYETAQFFFGREVLTEKLLNALRGGNRFLAVFGPSGSGKSSVVRGGMLPALKNGQLPDSQKWAQITMRPADNPFEQMKNAGLDPIDISGYLKSHADMERVVLFVDQFEELFTLCSEEVRVRFVQDLANALENPKLILVLAMRDDFYSVFNAKASPLAESEHLKIENVPRVLKRDELMKMIEQPAVTVGVTVEEGLTERIIRDLTHDGDARSSTLPLMEFTLTQMWEKRSDGQLKHEAYQTIGGVTGSLARWADDAYSALPKADQQVAESLLTSLVHLGDEAQGLPDTRRRLILTDINESTQIVIKHFTDRRLLVTSDHTVELVHDALVREWARLRNWLEQDRANLKSRDGIIEAARQWETSGRDESLLNHRAGRLEDAVTLSKVSRYGLASTEKAYLDACVQFKEREKNAREKMQRRNFIGLACFSIAIVVLLIFALVGLNQSRALQLGFQAEVAVAENNYNAAALYAYQSNQIHPNDTAAGILGQLPYENFGLGKGLLGPTNGVNSVAWSTDGRLASFDSGLYGEVDNTVIIWNIASGQPSQILRGHQDVITSVAWSVNGQLASGSTDRTIIIWNLASGQPSQILKGHTGHVVSVAWSADGRLASGSRDKTVILWDLATGRPAQILKGHTELVTSVAWSADGRLASASRDKTIIIWDLATGQPTQILKGHTEGVTSIAWSPDGRLASASADKTIIIWDLTTGQAAKILRGHTDFVESVAWSIDGRLVSGSWDKTVMLWDLAKGQPSQILRGHTEGVTSVAWSADGRLASADNTVIIWRLAPFQPAQTLNAHTGTINSVGWSSDGRLASGSYDKTVIIWDKATGHPAQILTGHTEPVLSVAWSGDGRLASGSWDKTVIIWDLTTDQPAQILKGHSGMVNSVAWSADGRLASGSADGTVIIWDLTTGRPAQIFRGHLTYVTSVAWSADGRLASAAWDDNIIIWDLATGQPAKIWKGHTARAFPFGVSSLAWSPDGHLASGSDDKTIIIWNLATGQPAQTLKGHTDFVNSLAWSADGRLASGSDDWNVLVWDLAAGHQPAQILKGNKFIVNSVAWSVDGRLASASDVTVKVARADLIQSKPCDWIYRNMTADEWLDFQGVLYVYQPACPNLFAPAFDPRNNILRAIQIYNPHGKVRGMQNGTIHELEIALITWKGRIIILSIGLALFVIFAGGLWALYKIASWLSNKIYKRFRAEPSIG